MPTRKLDPRSVQIIKTALREHIQISAIRTRKANSTEEAQVHSWEYVSSVFLEAMLEEATSLFIEDPV